jgi:predicted  nucleic acid-binding Zn-ribbon protein
VEEVLEKIQATLITQNAVVNSMVERQGKMEQAIEGIKSRVSEADRQTIELRYRTEDLARQAADLRALPTDFQLIKAKLEQIGGLVTDADKQRLQLATEQRHTNRSIVLLVLAASLTVIGGQVSQYLNWGRTSASPNPAHYQQSR